MKSPPNSGIGGRLIGLVVLIICCVCFTEGAEGGVPVHAGAGVVATVAWLAGVGRLVETAVLGFGAGEDVDMYGCAGTPAPVAGGPLGGALNGDGALFIRLCLSLPAEVPISFKASKNFPGSGTVHRCGTVST
jgi:hypothetical protein